MQLGLGAGRPGPVSNGHLDNTQALLHALNGDFRLNLKARHGQVQQAYTVSSERPVAGEDVREMNSINIGKEAVDHFISDHVQPLQGSSLDIFQPVTHDV